MSSKFLTFIFIILVSVQLSSCGWSLWRSDKKENLSTEKNFKDEEPNSSASLPIEDDTNMIPPPKDSSVASSDDDEDEASSTVKPTAKTTENESKMPNEGFDEYPEEESYKSPNSEKEIKSIPSSSTISTDAIVKYLSSVSTQIPDSSTTTTEESESVSPSTDNTNTPATSENTLNVTGNNVPRSVDEGSANSVDTSVDNSSPSSTDDNANTQNSSVGNSSEFITPDVTYSPNLEKINSSVDEEKEPTSNDQPSGRKDKETLSPRDVTDDTDYSTQKITTENSESERSSTAMTNTPTITETTLNSTSNNEARNVIDDTGNYDNSSKSETVSDLDPSESLQENTTIKTILSTSTDTMNTTEMVGYMSNVTAPEVNYGSFVNSGSTGNSYSQLILNLCILIFSISVIV